MFPFDKKKEQTHAHFRKEEDLKLLNHFNKRDSSSWVNRGVNYLKIKVTNKINLNHFLSINVMEWNRTFTCLVCSPFW